jgi:branched-chain amino acid transport system permease protein
VNTVVVLALTGLGLAALYFLVACGLSLVFGLADVLNFAHGLMLTAGAYATWWASATAPGGFPAALGCGVAAGTLTAVAIELVIVRRLYGRPVDQVLATVGLSLAGVAAVQAAWGTDPRTFPAPAWTQRVVRLGGSALPANRLLLIAGAAAVLAALAITLRYSRFGLIIRAGVENREMVTALGIDVRIAFTGVFALSGAVAGLAGGLGGTYFGAITPDQGSSLLVFAIIIVVIGGLASITGTAVAALLVGLVQQFVNYYAAPGVGDISVLALLAVILILRPQGIAGRRLA